MEVEHYFQCPYCWQEISMILDLSLTEQTYIEDCEICCRPIQIYYEAEEGELRAFDAARID